MTRMETGVLSRFCTDLLVSHVTYCIIEATRYGINWMFNIGSSDMLALGNQIYMDGSSSVGVLLKENNNAATSNYFVEENFINVEDGISAINGTTIYGSSISNNIIHLMGTPTLDMTGIDLEDSDSTFINCNTITGDDESDTLKTGISVSISSRTQVGCNSTDSTGYGFFFGGICSESEFKGNSMNDHYTGLFLNKFAVIDQQPAGGSSPYHGNTWLDTLHYTSGFGAVSLNADSLSTLQLSLFTTKLSIPANNPKIPINDTLAPFYVNDQGWFLVQNSGSTFECLDAEFCGSSTLTGGGDELRMMIAQENELTSEFIEESKIIAGQQLFAELHQDTNLLSQNSLYADYYSEKLTLSTGKLNSVKLDLGNLFSFTDSIRNILLSLNSEIEILTDSILVLDSIDIAITILNYNSLRESLMNQVYILQQAKLGYHSAEAISDSLMEISALSLNESISSINLPDENEKVINEIYLVGGFNSNYLLSYLIELTNIANQCPYVGGPAVYRARTILSSITDNISYNDIEICISNGIYRHRQSDSNDAFKWIRIMPNPANQKVLIELNGEFKGLCEIQLLDAAGRQLNSSKFECSSKSYSLNVSALPVGVYQITVSVNDDKLFNTKLVISR